MIANPKDRQNVTLSAYTLRAPEQIKRSAASQGPAVAA